MNIIKNTQQGQKIQNFIFNAQNELSIIKHPEACYFVGFQKHEKAKTNIMRYVKYLGKIRVTNYLRRKIEQNLLFFAFSWLNYRNMNFDQVWQKFKWTWTIFYFCSNHINSDLTYHIISYFEVEGVFNDNLKNLFKSTRNIPNSPKSVPTPPNLEEILMTDTKK